MWCNILVSKLVYFIELIYERIVMSRFPNLSKDQLLMTKEINIQLDGKPALNFKTGNLDSFSKLHYQVKMYKKAEGKKYYIFEAKDDCTMFIMNCNKDIYDILKDYIEINDNIDIFEPFNDHYVIIPTSYRHIDGYGGPTVISF